ncbi:tetratricopeptide repeat protein [candidate division GN15 bacterium]|nr:tetratricopeptide repeat protein [candidate division GN15 bacterium]
MFCLFCTAPVESTDTIQSGSRRFFTWFLLTVWALLLLFGIVAAFDPPWLREAAEAGIGNDARAVKDVADRYLRQGEYARAITQYDLALEIRPDYPEAIVNQSVACLQANQGRRAAKLLARALKYEDISHGTVYYNLGRYLEGEGRNDEALECYRRSLNCEVPPALAWRTLGSLHLQLGHADSALAAFDSALALFRDPEARYTDMLRRALMYYAEDSVHSALLISRLSEGVPPEELAAYDWTVVRQEIARDREIAKLHNHLGVILARKGEYAEARQHFDSSNAIWPGNIDARQNLALIDKIEREGASTLTRAKK